MLTKLSLVNFRGFRDHSLPLRRFTVAVGVNNAGKTTLVEALRLVSLVSSRYRNLRLRPPPDWLDRPRREVGVAPSLKSIAMAFDRALFYGYSDPPAELVATFADKSFLTIYLGGEGEIHAVLRNPDGEVVRTRADLAALNVARVEIMPQVGPVSSDETLLTADYVRVSLSSPLAPRHFRNQLYLLSDSFRDFKVTAEENWPGLQILSLESGSSLPGDPLDLQVRNRDFVGELALMGHGLQMWLQAIWFLTRSRQAQCLILDEPDVYMHPDLQRRLIRFLRARREQVIVTTHSVEIMSEVSPSSILIVDRRRTHSRFADTLPAVQRLLHSVGSAQNIHLTRLWGARKCILVEGEEFKILKRVHDLVCPDAESLETIPNMPIGGWDGWAYAVGSSMAFRNAMGEEVTTYCILDSDYHTPDQVATRLEDARDKDVELYIWSRKEIENYLLLPAVIHRIIVKRRKRGSPPSEDQIRAKLEELAQEREDDVLDGLAIEIQKQNRKWDIRRVNTAARSLLRERKDAGQPLVDIAPGKVLLADLSKWAQTTFGVSIGAGTILREMTRQDLPIELVRVVELIQDGESFAAA